MELYDCPDCGAPAAIERDRQICHVPTPDGTIVRAEHADGVWCETFRPRPNPFPNGRWDD